MLSMQADIFKTLLSWAVLLPTIFLIGSWFRPFVPTEQIVLQGIFYCAIGLAFLSYAVLFLDAVHELNPAGIWILLIGCLLFSASKTNDWIRWMKSVFRDLSARSTRADKILPLFFFVSLVAALLGALAPETGGDALCYQLNLPKIFLARGSLSPMPYDPNSYFPMFFNHLYLIGLATGGVFSAKFFHLFSGFLLFLAVKVITEKETNNESLAYFAALVVWLTPTVYNLLSTTYIDVGFALYAFLALAALKYSFAPGRKNSVFLLSGVLAGIAAAFKSLGAVVLIPLFAVWGCALAQKVNMSRPWQKMGNWILGAALAWSWWPVRNWIRMHNPVFPYLANWFGTEPIPEMSFYSFNGTGRGFIDFFSLFWNVSLKPFFLGAFSNQLGIFYFLLLPAVIAAAFFVKRSRYDAAFSGLFLMLWVLFFPRSGRYVLPALPAFAVAAAMGLAWFHSRFTSPAGVILTRLAAVLGMALLFLYLAAGLYHYRYVYRLHSGKWTAEEYLVKMERTVPVAKWINQNLPPTAHLLMEGETRQFYIERPVIRNFFLKFMTRYDQRKLDAPSLSGFFKSLGITHLLIGAPVSGREATESEQALGAVLKSRSVKLIQTMQSQNIHEEQYLYWVYVLT